MVGATISALEQGKTERQTFERPSLLLHCEGKAKAETLDPAIWLRPGMLEAFLESRQTSLVDRLRRVGLDQMPAICANEGKGGKGIQRCYWLAVTSIPQDLAGQEELRQWGKVEYRRTEAGEVKPSWLLRWLFQNGELRNRSWRGLSLLVSVLFGVTLLALWLLTGLWGVSSTDQTLTLRQLGASAFFCLGAWFVWRDFYRPWIQLVDDRVVKTPVSLLSLWEDSAELEMHRDSEKHQWTRFIRFSGDCPLCSGRVLLMPGRPEHKLPLVGRCSESPHAHVFSFDRARLTGAYIGPSLA
ncbi:hypothetical protein D3880_02245 [Pseudomonas cavernae]|uniref:Uncharacterized protein n=2 Tax=Pseudomonas cavernae TaxID=2320867 RepID=A0A385YXU9_9PSED|nr:hypothetical protein D3880_02245 [Pseudomonas cavernae]